MFIEIGHRQTVARHIEMAITMAVANTIGTMTHQNEHMRIGRMVETLETHMKMRGLVKVQQLIVNHRTNEDMEKLLEKLLAKNMRRMRHQKDADCKKGQHGFTVETWASGGYIHNKCTNCGAYWNSPDMPMTI